MSNGYDVVSESKPAGMKNVFVGPQGLRSGWRVLLFLPVFIAASIPVGIAILPAAHSELSPYRAIIGELCAFAIILAGTLIFARVEHRSLADYGIPFRLFLGKQFWTGAVWGFVMVSFLVGLMAASHAYSFGHLALSPAEIVKYGLLWGLAFLLVGFFEEFSFRGYVQYTLTRGIGFWPAAAITCILFALAHTGNPDESPVGIIEIVLIASFLCLALRRTGNLWFAIGWHMAFDWGESFFYSTADSGMRVHGHLLNSSMMGSTWLNGGKVGPEASVFDVIVTVAGILLLAKLYPEPKYPALPAPTPTLEFRPNAPPAAPVTPS